jgi:hypothetical protein
MEIRTMRMFPLSSHPIWAWLLLSIPIVRAVADDYSDNLAKWNAMRPSHYQYRYTPGCYCPLARWQVEAKAGTVIAADKLIGDGISTPSDLRMFGMDSLFRFIKRTREENPYKLTVTYNREFGYPDWIYVDPKLSVADDEHSIAIDQFKVMIPGLTVSPDTVYESSMAEIPAGKKVLALANTGDSALYLNSVEVSFSPTDTFALGTVSLQIHRKSSANGGRGEYYSFTGMSRPDTLAALGGILLPPGDSAVFDEFLVGTCACLRKTGAVIGSGKLFNALLRFNLSRDESGGAGGLRAYAWFQGLYDATTSIGSGPGRPRESSAAQPALPSGSYPARGRYYGLDGKPRKTVGIPAMRIRKP